MKKQISISGAVMVLAAMVTLASAVPALAETTAALDSSARNAYSKLVAKVATARELNKRAVAVLVFPKITKAGLVIGGQYGEGVLFRNGQSVGYYSTAGASYGLQAGAQQFGYAMFFMHEHALQALTETDGFEVGVGPSVVVVDEGMAKSATSMTMKDDVYAFVFGQKGLMAGVGLQGNKITKLAK